MAPGAARLALLLDAPGFAAGGFLDAGLFLGVAAFAPGAAAVALGWALIERGRAARAEIELRLTREHAETGRDILAAQSAQTANAVAEELVRRGMLVKEAA